MSQQNGKIKWDLKTILTAVCVVIVIYLVLTGRIPLFSGSGQNDVTSLPIATQEQNAPAKTDAAPQQTAQAKTTAAQVAESTKAYVTYRFRNSDRLNEHYEKHGKDMGFKSAKDYEKAASDVINNPDALTKREKEDNDYVFYVEATNEFVVLSEDGYIRTYFYPDAGKAYYDRQ